MSITGEITRDRVLAWAKSVPYNSVWWLEDDLWRIIGRVIYLSGPSTGFMFDRNLDIIHIYSIKLRRKSRRHAVLNTLSEPQP